MVKNPPTTWENWVRSLDWEDALEEGMTTHSSILAWRIPMTEKPGGLQSMGSQRAGHWATKHTQAIKMPNRDFPWHSRVKSPPFNAEGAGSIPGRGPKIPHALGPKKPKQRQYSNKFNKDQKKKFHIKKSSLKKMHNRVWESALTYLFLGKTSFSPTPLPSQEIWGPGRQVDGGKGCGCHSPLISTCLLATLHWSTPEHMLRKLLPSWFLSIFPASVWYQYVFNICLLFPSL